MNEPETTRALRTEAPRRDPLAGAVRPRLPAEGDLVLGRYRLERMIGRGGHGTVWEALDERLERAVAVKVIERGEGSVGPRAEREGRVAARLNHPGIVGLYELGSDAGTVYLVSELVRGRTMAELNAAGALSDRDVCEIGLALCSALEHAHEDGVVHRDVKPQNVIVLAEPAAGAGFAKLTDFGVAHVAGEETLTRTGAVVGTLAYMAPEQAEGGRVDAAADVYSLALILHEGWTGSGPEGAVAARLAGRRVPPLRRMRRDLPPELWRAVDAALDPRPEARPPLRELASALAAAEDALSERGGLVEPATRRRFDIPSAAAFAARGSSVPGWAGRAAAGVAAGGLVAAGLELLAPTEFVVAPGAAAAAVAALVAVLPRIGWLLAAGALVAWLASPGVDRQGTALVLAAALAPVPILLPRAGLLWSAPALAPLAGALGAAPLFVAAAGLASTAWRRAGLALAGFGWLVAAELLEGDRLFLGVADGAGSSGAWRDSLVDAARDAIYPTVTSTVLVGAAVWAVLALALGIAVRGRSRPLDLVGAALWVVAAIAAHEWLTELVTGEDGSAAARGAVAGAVLGAGVAVLAAIVHLPRARFERRLPPLEA